MRVGETGEGEVGVGKMGVGEIGIPRLDELHEITFKYSLWLVATLMHLYIVEGAYVGTYCFLNLCMNDSSSQIDCGPLESASVIWMPIRQLLVRACHIQGSVQSTR